MNDNTTTNLNPTMDKLLSELKKAIAEDLAQKTPSESSQATSMKEKKLSTETEGEKPLVLKTNLCYIVSAVIIQDGKVLMMKEAKKSCRGLWYLPAGRLEPNETLVEGVKREVLEETGLTFEPTSLVCVDFSITLNWHRYTFTGNVTGGKLKSPEDADKESIEARWFAPREVYSQTIIPLRAPDIIPLIRVALRWKEVKERDPIFISLPVGLPHKRITIQVLLVTKTDQEIQILLDKDQSNGLLQTTPPTVCCTVKDVITLTIKKAVGVNVNKDDYKLHGIITVEHTGKPHGVADGTCLTALTEAEMPFPVSSSNRYEWWGVRDEGLKCKIGQLLDKGCIEIV